MWQCTKCNGGRSTANPSSRFGMPIRQPARLFFGRSEILRLRTGFTASRSGFDPARILVRQRFPASACVSPHSSVVCPWDTAAIYSKSNYPGVYSVMVSTYISTLRATMVSPSASPRCVQTRFLIASKSTPSVSHPSRAPAIEVPYPYESYPTFLC